MKHALAVAVLVACGLALCACGSDDEGAITPTAKVATVPATPPRQEVDARVPVALPPAERARFVAGRDVASRSGCLACHRIGTAGSDTPGSNLTAIGERRSRAELRRSLVAPQAPMPTFDELPAEDLDALVTFLSGLRATDCPDGSDCG